MGQSAVIINVNNLQQYNLRGMFYLCTHYSQFFLSMGKCKKKDTTSLLMHWSNIFLALTHQYQIKKNCNWFLEKHWSISRISKIPEKLIGYMILMALHKTAVTPLLMHWSYCSLTPSHRYGVNNATIGLRQILLFLVPWNLPMTHILMFSFLESPGYQQNDIAYVRCADSFCHCRGISNTSVESLTKNNMQYPYIFIKLPNSSAYSGLKEVQYFYERVLLAQVHALFTQAAVKSNGSGTSST